MRTQFTLGLIGFSLAVLCGRLDRESQSLWDVFQLQNWPAIAIYSLIFYGVLLGIYLLGKFCFRVASDDGDMTAGI